MTAKRIDLHGVLSVLLEQARIYKRFRSAVYDDNDAIEFNT